MKLSTRTPRRPVPAPVHADGATQGDLFPSLVHAGGRTIEERFAAFHAANPWVYDALVAMIADDIANEVRPGGIRMYWEVLRHRYNRRTVDRSSKFRANDHYPRSYARLIIAEHPEWSTHFYLRTIRAA